LTPDLNERQMRALSGQPIGEVNRLESGSFGNEPGAMEQRFTFNAVAELYDRARAGYPPALYDDLIALADLSPGDPILEIGCGTGKATEEFERRGLNVVALDPGGDMIAAARRRVAHSRKVRFVETTFEAWSVEASAFRLVAAAQSWHWVAPEIRFTKAYEALAPGGALAVFGTSPEPAPQPFRAALEQVYAIHAPELGGPPPEHAYLPSGVFPRDFDRSGLFGPVIHKSYPWSRSFTAQTYVAYLGSISRYQLMESERRENLLAALERAIEAQGGAFDAPVETHLYLAVRKA
jgi:ubiquinone/menaquinone biosynthesis C-methylase UbiE